MSEVSVPRTALGLPNAVVGMLLFLAAEAMFFAGLISAFLILRANAVVWPPPGQPRLPLMITSTNLVILLASGVAMWRAAAMRRRDQMAAQRRWILITIGLGVIFLLVQGSEWVRLLRFGFHTAAEVYGGIFYTIIGCHGLHVAGGLVCLATLLRQRRPVVLLGRVEAVRLYWTFVVGLWPLLYVLVYVI
jgi:heme/copper-type cytochrome/quinol oxidase subunit 3